MAIREKTISEKFREIIIQVRQEGYKINHCLVNSIGELKILAEITFVANAIQIQVNTGQIGSFYGIPIFSAKQQKSEFAFVVETPSGFFTITETEAIPYKSPGPTFITRITKCSAQNVEVKQK